MNGDHMENEESERNTLKSKESVKIQKKTQVSDLLGPWR